MTNALQTKPLMAAIATAIEAAWGKMTVYYEPPTTVQPLPYAVVIPQDVEISESGKFASATWPDQFNSFLIVGRFLVPTDPSVVIVFEKADRVSELIAQLQPSATFAGIAGDPLVSNVSFDEMEVEGEGAYTTSCVFGCHTRAPHH